jgi:hypothetical protein
MSAPRLSYRRWTDEKGGHSNQWLKEARGKQIRQGS